MVIFIDTNILISAALSSKGTSFLAFKKAITLPNRAVICQQNIDELRRIFSKKFPNKMYALEIFIADIFENLDVIEIPNKYLAIYLNLNLLHISKPSQLTFR